MPRVRLQGINTIRRRLAGGREAVYHYHRATGTRLPDEIGSPAFIKALIAAETLVHHRDDETVSGLISAFSASSDWDALRESTRTIMRLNLKAVEGRFGNMPVDALDDRRVRTVFLDWRDDLAVKHPRAADAKLSALARVLAWAADRGRIASNPLDKFRRVYSVDRSDKIWMPEHVAAFEAHATADMRNAMMLALHTGQRQGDILRLTWSAYDGRALSLRQSKTSARVYVPCTVALRTLLDGLPRSDRALTILTNPRGLAWSSDGFKKSWSATATRAGIADLHFHDLRGTAVTMLSEAGAIPQEIATITGHSLAGVERILDRYLSRTKPLAESAIAKLDEHPRNRLLQNGVKNLQNDMT